MKSAMYLMGHHLYYYFFNKTKIGTQLNSPCHFLTPLMFPFHLK